MKNTNEVQIPGLDIRKIEIKIKGISPLIVHRFGEKARKQILDIQNKSAKKRKERIPEEEYLETIHFFEDGVRSGFPAVGFKSAMVRAGKKLGLVMTDLRGSFFVIPDEGDLIEVHGTHEMRIDMVRVGNGGTDIRYRAMYKEWESVLQIEYDAKAISSEGLAQLVAEAGFAPGIGEWRPQKGGTFGRWSLA